MGNSTKTIIDLDTRCILKISSFLRLSDIVNIADAFNINGEHISKIENYENSTDNNQNDQMLIFATTLQTIFLKLSGGEWYIDNEKYVLHTVKVLRCFGNLISSLAVDYCKISADECMAIDDAILVNCRETLKMMSLCYVHKNTFSHITDAFQSVNVINIYGGFLNKRLSKFQRWFPKLSELDIEQVHLEKPHCIEHHFPHLTVLRISNGIEENVLPESSWITDSNVKITMQLNPQIKSLNLSDDLGGRDDFGICLSQKSLLFIQRKLLNLRHLKLTIGYLDYKPIKMLETVNFEHLTTLTLIVKNWSYLSIVLISSQRLEKLILESEASDIEMREAYKIISTFIQTNTNINCLFINSIHSDYDLYDDHVIGLVNDLWNLDEFNIEFNWQGTMAADAIIHFLMNCKQLNKFTVHWNDDMNLSTPDTELTDQFLESFNNFASINLFDVNTWVISFDNCWKSSTSVSFSKN